LQGDESDIESVIRIYEVAKPAAADLRPGARAVVLTWLHLGDRDVLAVHPRGDVGRPLTGVFSTRSQDRPNPIGLHEVEIIAVESDRLQVRGLEAIDGTPVIDIKPVLEPRGAR
jgi:tRNA-Thr(GGU) m(6)t(6)A37 methyltransferase TsaA